MNLHRRFRTVAVAAGAALFVAGALIGCESSGKSSAADESPAHVMAPPASPAPNASAHASMQATGNRLYYPTGDRDSSMLMLEKTAPAQARMGKPYNYQITVTNLTAAPLQGVVVQEALPGSFAIAAAEPGKTAPATQPAANAPMAQRTHNIGELGPNESRTINLTGTPSQAGAMNSCTSVVCNPTLCMSAMVTNPQLKITKEVIGAAGGGDICEPQTLRYTVTNTGTGDISGVRVDDALPDGLATQDGVNKIGFNVGTLAQSQAKAFDVKVKAARAGEFSSAAVASADDGISAKSEAAAMAIKAPKLEVSLKAPEKEYLGSAFKYDVTVKNVGNATAKNPTVRISTGGDVASAAKMGDTAQLASDREGPSASAAGRDAGQSIGELAPGASKTITLAYNPQSEGDLKVNAIATDRCAGSANAEAVTRVTGLPALLLSAVDDHDPIRIGENVVYTITVLNQGFGDDKNIKVVATLPEGEEFVSADGDSKGTADGNKVTFATVSSITPKQTLTWKLVVKATKAADVRLRVDMNSDSFPDAAVKVEPTRLY